MSNSDRSQAWAAEQDPHPLLLEAGQLAHMHNDLAEMRSQCHALEKAFLDGVQSLCRRILPVNSLFDPGAENPIGGGRICMAAPSGGWGDGDLARVAEPLSVCMNSRGEIRWSAIVRIRSIRIYASGSVFPEPLIASPGFSSEMSLKLVGLAMRAIQAEGGAR